MTNEQAKQDAIKKAWGELWKDVHEFVNMKNGWCCPAFYQPGGILFDLRKRHKELKSWLDYGDNTRDWPQFNVRPKSLRGIETNNGWTRIEPNGSNLPEHKKGRYEVFDGKQIHEGNCYYNADFNWWEYVSIKLPADGIITHYKPVKKEPKPIY